MSSKSFIYSFIFFLLIFHQQEGFIAQNKIEVQNLNSINKPWTSEIANDYKGKFHFVVVSDRTGSHREGVWEDGINKINLMQPAFVVSVGDLIEGYTRNKKEINKQWKEFNSFINKLEAPFFYVAGNHDYTNKTMENEWLERYGASYYYFIYNNVLFLCLNSEHGHTALKDPDIGSDQVDFVNRVLTEHSDVAWTMVFMHQPLWLNESGLNWLKVEKLLSSRKHSVFTGHHHNYTLYERNNNDYFVLATLGGRSDLRGKEYGEFDHLLWITMTNKGPYFSNLMLDGIYDKNIRRDTVK